MSPRVSIFTAIVFAASLIGAGCGISSEVGRIKGADGGAKGSKPDKGGTVVKVDKGTSPAKPDKGLPTSKPDKGIIVPKTDAGKGGCIKASECGKASCRQVGTICFQDKPACTKGKCTKITNALSKYTCNAALGLCKPPTTGGCKAASDCGKPSCSSSGTSCKEKRWACTSGKCSFSYKSVSNAGCDAKTGRCVPGVDTCTKAGGFCWTTKLCKTGSKYDSTKKCLTPGHVCCVKSSGSGGCKAASDCGKPSCLNSGTDCKQKAYLCTTGTCSSKTTVVSKAACDFSTGMCKPGSVSDTCSPSGGFCYGIATCKTGYTPDKTKTCPKATDVCCKKSSSGGCAKNTDCGLPSCRNVSSGGSRACYQSSPTCGGGKCSFPTKTVAGASCNAATGLCK